jgi:hypothetical protein
MVFLYDVLNLYEVEVHGDELTFESLFGVLFLFLPALFGVNFMWDGFFENVLSKS